MSLASSSATHRRAPIRSIRFRSTESASPNTRWNWKASATACTSWALWPMRTRQPQSTASKSLPRRRQSRSPSTVNKSSHAKSARNLAPREKSRRATPPLLCRLRRLPQRPRHLLLRQSRLMPISSRRRSPPLPQPNGRPIRIVSPPRFQRRTQPMCSEKRSAESLRRESTSN